MLFKRCFYQRATALSSGRGGISADARQGFPRKKWVFLGGRRGLFSYPESDRKVLRAGDGGEGGGCRLVYLCLGGAAW